MRSILTAHGIDAVVGAELAGLGGASFSNDLWVADEDKEEAATLLRDLRERAAAVPADGDAALDEAMRADPDFVEDDDARAAGDVEDDDARAAFQERIDRRRR